MLSGRSLILLMHLCCYYTTRAFSRQVSSSKHCGELTLVGESTTLCCPLLALLCLIEEVSLFVCLFFDCLSELSSCDVLILTYSDL